MQVIDYEDGPVEEKTGQLSWMLDTGIMVWAAVCAIMAVILLGLWWHRSHNPDAAVAAFFAPGDPDITEAQAGPTGAPLLWVMKDADSTVYLFGGGNSQSEGWADQRLFMAFDGADRVVFEAGAYPNALPSDKGVLQPDAALFHRAVALQKPTAGLASADRLHVAAAGVVDDGFTLPADAWRMGDEKTLTDNLAAQAQADATGYNTVILRPNQAWLPQIERALAGQGTVFVTLDSAHLIGPDGLISQLRHRGHDITRLDSVSRSGI